MFISYQAIKLAIMFFKKNVSASCYISALTGCTNWIAVTGTDAKWLHSSHLCPILHFTRELPSQRGHSVPSSNLHHMSSNSSDIDLWSIYCPADLTIAFLKFKWKGTCKAIKVWVVIISVHIFKFLVELIFC